MSISTTAANDTVTGRTPNAWAAGRANQAQSATFRALAWSQVDDDAAGLLPYTGDEYQEYVEPASDSRPTMPVAVDTAEPPAETRYRRSALLYGIAAGFVAAAVGGLVITVLNTGDGPVAIPTKFTQPATAVVNSQPTGATANQEAPVRASTPAPVKNAGAPAHIPSAAAPSRAFAAPAPQLQSSPAPASPAPEAAAPVAPAPEAPAPEPKTPEYTAPDAKPPVWVPTPQGAPHPLGPINLPMPSGPINLPSLPTPSGPIHLPTPSGPVNLPTPSGPVNLPTPSGPIHLPAGTDVVIPAPAASNPVITLNPGVTIPPMVPKLPSN